MSRPKYKLQKGTVRTPEEHRRILNEIDNLQNHRSKLGTYNTDKKRVKRKKTNKRPRIYDLDRFARE